MPADTSDYDPRFDRAQTVAGAKARYVNLDSYSLANLESDVERILSEGEAPDRGKPPLSKYGSHETVRV